MHRWHIWKHSTWITVCRMHILSDLWYLATLIVTFWFGIISFQHKRTALAKSLSIYWINLFITILLPFPSLVLAFLIGPSWDVGWLPLTVFGCATVTVSTAAATAAATAVADVPLKGLLALNSRHLAPNTVIIFDIGILGFFLAMRGLRETRGRGDRNS